MKETCVWSLCREDPLEYKMATHSSILAWEIPWTEEPARLQSVGCRRVGCDLVTTHTHTHTHTHECYVHLLESKSASIRSQTSVLVLRWPCWSLLSCRWHQRPQGKLTEHVLSAAFGTVDYSSDALSRESGCNRKAIPGGLWDLRS